MTTDAPTACPLPPARRRTRLTDTLHRFWSGPAQTRGALASEATGARMASAAATTLTLGAVACGVCCALPLALPAVALASSGGLLAFVARAWWVPYAATAMVAGAWLWVAARTRRTSRRPARATIVTLVVATVALAVALLLPLVEPSVAAWLRTPRL